MQNFILTFYLCERQYNLVCTGVVRAGALCVPHTPQSLTSLFLESQKTITVCAIVYFHVFRFQRCRNTVVRLFSRGPYRSQTASGIRRTPRQSGTRTCGLNFKTGFSRIPGSWGAHGYYRDDSRARTHVKCASTEIEK